LAHLQIARYRGGAFEDEEPALAAVLQHMQHIPEVHSDEEDEFAEEAFWNQHPQQLDNEHPIVDADLAPAADHELHQVYCVVGGGWDQENPDPALADAGHVQLQAGENEQHVEAQEQVVDAGLVAEEEHQPAAAEEQLDACTRCQEHLPSLEQHGGFEKRHKSQWWRAGSLSW
jgi:hypothetical protein